MAGDVTSLGGIDRFPVSYVLVIGVQNQTASGALLKFLPTYEFRRTHLRNNHGLFQWWRAVSRFPGTPKSMGARGHGRGKPDPASGTERRRDHTAGYPAGMEQCQPIPTRGQGQFRQGIASKCLRRSASVFPADAGMSPVLAGCAAEVHVLPS
jgi:hypothetical protein